MPNKTYYHGGNLDAFSRERLPVRKGRREYGPGLYLTDHRPTADKYARGSRKLYSVDLSEGTDIVNVRVQIDALISWVDSCVSVRLRRKVISRLREFERVDHTVALHIFNNILVNENAVKPANVNAWRNALVMWGADYEIVSNAFGFGETMAVVYNLRKVENIKRIAR